MKVFQGLNREITIVLVTHERDVAAYAGRVVTCDGRIVSDVRQASHRRARTARWRRNELARMTSRAAARALRRNKMRSALTMLGIIIGVAR